MPKCLSLFIFVLLQSERRTLICSRPKEADNTFLVISFSKFIGRNFSSHHFTVQLLRQTADIAIVAYQSESFGFILLCIFVFAHSLFCPHRLAISPKRKAVHLDLCKTHNQTPSHLEQVCIGQNHSSSIHPQHHIASTQ